MENQSSSVGIVSQDTQYWNCFVRSKRRWQRTEANLNSSEIEASSCRCTTSRLDERWKWTSVYFVKDIGHSWTRENWCGTHTYEPEGLWNCSAEKLMLHLRECGHLVFRATKCVGPRIFEKTRKEGSYRYTTTVTAELLFRTIISVNQLRVYGAISDWCAGLAQQISDHSFSSKARPVANMNEESDYRLSPDVVMILTNPHSNNVQRSSTGKRSHRQRAETLPEDMHVFEACENAWFTSGFSWTIFVTIHDMDDGFGSCWIMPRIHISSKWWTFYSEKDGFKEIRKIGPVLEVKVTHHPNQYGFEIS